MKLFRNLLYLLKFFIISFAILFFIYFFRVIDINNLLKEFDMNIIKRFVINYTFYIFVVASVISIIFIGTLNKFRGYAATIITIVLLSLIVISYPLYVLIGNHNIEFLENENTFLDINEKTFTKVDKYIVKANNKLFNNGYKDGILIDAFLNNKIYFADYIYVSNKTISMFNVKEINGINLEIRNSVEIERKSMFYYLSSISKDVVFGFSLVPFLNLSLRYLTVESRQIHVVLILFSQFFLIFLALYMLGLSFNSKKYIYHNMLTGFLIYGIMQIIFTIANVLMHNLNFWNITAFIYFIAIFVIMISFIIKRFKSQ